MSSPDQRLYVRSAFPLLDTVSQFSPATGTAGAVAIAWTSGVSGRRRVPAVCRSLSDACTCQVFNVMVSLLLLDRQTRRADDHSSDDHQLSLCCGTTLWIGMVDRRTAPGLANLAAPGLEHGRGSRVDIVEATGSHFGWLLASTVTVWQSWSCRTSSRFRIRQLRLAVLVMSAVHSFDRADLGVYCLWKAGLSLEHSELGE